MRTFWLFLIALPAAAQIAPPRIGCFIDAQQRLRPVYGTAGNFIVSGPEREGVLAALCAAGLTIVKTENAIEVNGTVLAAPPGPASIAPDGLVCYATGECERFGAGFPTPRVEARILQCRPEGRQTLLTSARDDSGLLPPQACDKVRPPLPPVAAQIRISNHRRNRLESGPYQQTSEPSRDRRERWTGACTELQLQPYGPVLIAGNRCIGLPSATVRVHYLGPGWLRIVLAGGGHMALSLERMAIYALPEVMP